MTDLNKLAEEAYTIAHQRKLNGAKINPDSVIDMLKHCATEVVEATEAYTDLATEAYNDLVDQYRERFPACQQRPGCVRIRQDFLGYAGQ